MTHTNKTIIIGKNSNLSKHLEKALLHTHSISHDKLEEFEQIAQDCKKPINIIFNQFQQATKLSSLDNPIEYIQRSIGSTSQILSYIKQHNIQVKKIIYTSSSSVYGNNPSSNEEDKVNPLNLHASLKVANEELVKKFSSENNIDFTIARLFNMYGGQDNFSIISKIISCSRNNTLLTLVNNGESIRDFIHIDDIVSIYTKLLSTSNIPVLNLGTADGKSILFVLDYLRRNGVNITTKSIQRDELKISISQNKQLLEILPYHNFICVEQYILKQLKDNIWE